MAREAEQQLEGGLVQRLSLRLRLLLQAHAVRAEQQRGGRGAELLRCPAASSSGGTSNRVGRVSARVSCSLRTAVPSSAPPAGGSSAAHSSARSSRGR
jgi:hypothetical protein